MLAPSYGNSDISESTKGTATRQCNIHCRVTVHPGGGGAVTYRPLQWHGSTTDTSEQHIAGKCSHRLLLCSTLTKRKRSAWRCISDAILSMSVAGPCHWGTSNLCHAALRFYFAKAKMLCATPSVVAPLFNLSLHHKQQIMSPVLPLASVGCA